MKSKRSINNTEDHTLPERGSATYGRLNFNDFRITAQCSIWRFYAEGPLNGRVIYRFLSKITGKTKKNKTDNIKGGWVANLVQMLPHNLKKTPPSCILGSEECSSKPNKKGRGFNNGVKKRHKFCPQL
eukprot:GEMP01131603.1.p1 GENE.GEMP01131603.1~~GEMP01131603.1.p1  ORF type:complete len:128 (-),score=1.11 GEMP01131603.1:48-431(-)